MVPDIQIKSVKINSKKSEFGKNSNTGQILTAEKGASAWAHNSLKIRQHFVRSLIEGNTLTSFKNKPAENRTAIPYVLRNR